MTRYVVWVGRHAWAILAAHVVLLAAAIYLIACRLPLYADFSYLLPQDSESVVDLRRLEARAKTTDTVLVVIEAPSSDERAAAAKEMAAGIRALPKELVDAVEDDDADVRAFLRAHEELFIPIADLEKAKRALDDRIALEKARANPMYVDLDGGDDSKDLDELRAKRKQAEDRLARSSHVSADGKVAMIGVRIAFPSTDTGRGEELVERLRALRETLVAANAGVKIGFTGGNITALAEHSAIASGILISSLVTAVLVGLVLALYFRSATLLVLLVGTLGTASALTFGAAALTVGHLNAATAFLGAIIAGNGVNYGILVIARYLEERRTWSVEDSLATAMAATLRPTAVASLAAAIAYGSLAATSFKGFADFAVIGAIGMILCWIETYVLLPALMLRFGRRTRIFHGDPFVGSVLVAVLGVRRPRVVLALAFVLVSTAGVIVVRYIRNDPFEYDLTHLRSVGADAVTARKWMKLSDDNFGRGFAGRTLIAADRPEQVPLIVDALHAADPQNHVMGPVSSILDVVPDHQAERLARLADLRATMDKAQIDDPKLLELRPKEVTPITIADLPPSLRDKLVEKDGRLGLMISIDTANGLDEWNGHDLVKFASLIRKLQLRNHETITTSGSSVIFADILDSIERDGPLVTGLAAILLVVMIAIVVGPNRRTLAVMAATTTGSLLMVATCALLGLKVNFLDFVALPITLGLGVDYAINIAHRNDEQADAITTLRTSGSAVFICSLTTIIGYASLLASDNLAIRGFGKASLIGEVTCVLTALVLVPALLARRRPKLPTAAVVREAA